MKRQLLGLAASLLLAPAVLGAAAFEGKVTFKMTPARGQAQDIRYAIKGGKFRLEITGDRNATATMIIDPIKRETIMIRDEEKMYMTMSLPADPPPGSAKAGEEVQIQKTGETERILGYTAEKYISKHENSTSELWLAEGIGSFVGPGAGAGPMGGGRGPSPAAAQSWEKALAGKALFPLRVVTRDAAGKESFRMQATSIEKQALTDAMFEPPADYRKFDMSEMMKGMGGGLPGMMRKKG